MGFLPKNTWKNPTISKVNTGFDIEYREVFGKRVVVTADTLMNNALLADQLAQNLVQADQAASEILNSTDETSVRLMQSALAATGSSTTGLCR